MIKKENVSWPKWPGLLVVGEKISEEQAAEILLKTQNWFLLDTISQESLLYKELKKIYVSSFPEEDRISDIDMDFDIIEQKIQPLEVNYLSNDRIYSSWIGGLHGWCDWDGNIFCNNYNVGKWPSIEYIEDELVLVASSFPFLNFTLQLLSEEIRSEENSYPIYTCEVKNGYAKEIDINDFICSTSTDSHSFDILSEDWLNDEKHVNRICKQFKKYF
jgi:hypothetical protein